MCRCGPSTQCVHFHNVYHISVKVSSSFTYTYMAMSYIVCNTHVLVKTGSSECGGSLSDLEFTSVSTTYVSYTPSLAGPDLPGEGRSGHYCQHSVDNTGMLARL